MVLASGVKPRVPPIAGIDHPKAISYPEAIEHPERVGKAVAIVGAGGIGFDVAEFLGEETVDGPRPASVEEFARHWGIDLELKARGGIEGLKPQPEPLAREIWLLQRKASKPGKGLGKTTGWIHRATLQQRGVRLMPGVTYRGVDDQGLHILAEGREQCLAVDQVILCAGQVPQRDLEPALVAAGTEVHCIGGADEAAELDAKRAIRQATLLAARL